MPRPRTPSRISDSFHQRLNAYALAASAAGVSLLALARTATAKIIYTPAHVRISANQHFDLDLNHDGITDFTIQNLYSYNRTSICKPFMAFVYESPASGNDAEGGYPFVSALPRGARISASQGFFGGQWMALHSRVFLGRRQECVSSHFGNWYSVIDRYLGLKFRIHQGTHYGWARLNVQKGQGKQLVATLTGYAYETIPNKPIIAGKTHGPDVITLQDASLGHLARGADAIKAWRGAN
jgi:hypothetical protein